jgi:hypothetical protein
MKNTIIETIRLNRSSWFGNVHRTVINKFPEGYNIGTSGEYE